MRKKSQQQENECERDNSGRRMLDINKEDDEKEKVS